MWIIIAFVVGLIFGAMFLVIWDTRPDSPYCRGYIKGYGDGRRALNAYISQLREEIHTLRGDFDDKTQN